MQANPAVKRRLGYVSPDAFQSETASVRTVNTSFAGRSNCANRESARESFLSDFAAVVANGPSVAVGVRDGVDDSSRVETESNWLGSHPDRGGAGQELTLRSATPGTGYGYGRDRNKNRPSAR